MIFVKYNVNRRITRFLMFFFLVTDFKPHQHLCFLSKLNFTKAEGWGYTIPIGLLSDRGACLWLLVSRRVTWLTFLSLLKYIINYFRTKTVPCTHNWCLVLVN